MKKFITTILAVTVVCTSALYAQLPNIIRDDIVINGLSLGAKYSKDQIVAALGQPDSINTILDESGYITTYHYGTDYFQQTEESLLVEFVITNPRFKFNNFISVGDPITRVALLGGTIADDEVVNYHGVLLKYKRWKVAKELNSNAYYSFSTLFYYDNEGFITKIAVVYYYWL